MATGFEYVVETDDIALYVGIGVDDAVTHTGLCCKVYHNMWLVFCKYVADELLVGNVAFYKLECGVLQQFFQALLLKADIVIVIHVVDTDNNVLGRYSAKSFYQVGAYETGCACYQYGFHTNSFLLFVLKYNTSSIFWVINSVRIYRKNLAKTELVCKSLNMINTDVNDNSR